MTITKFRFILKAYHGNTPRRAAKIERLRQGEPIFYPCKVWLFAILPRPPGFDKKEEEKLRKNRIQEYRLAKGLTQLELGARLGVAEATVADWERGRRFPRMACMFALAELFECRVEDLFPRERA